MWRGNSLASQEVVHCRSCNSKMFHCYIGTACKSVLSGLLSRDGLNNISLPIWDQAILSINAELSYSSIQIIIWFIYAYMPHQTRMKKKTSRHIQDNMASLVQIKGRRLLGTKPLSKSILFYYWYEPWEHILIIMKRFKSKKTCLNMSSGKLASISSRPYCAKTAVNPAIW